MLIYAITGYAHERQTFRSTWPYHEFFHGDCGAVVNRYGHRPYRSLPLIRNVNITPSVFFGGISMVVGEVLAAQLSEHTGIDIVPCSWDKIYNLPVDEAAVRSLLSRFSPFTEEFGEWLGTQLKSPRGATLTKYYEVVVPLLTDLSRARRCDSELRLPDVPHTKVSSVRSCAEIHQSYPMVQHSAYYICGKDVFRIIEPYVQDRELFRVVELDVGS